MWCGMARGNVRLTLPGGTMRGSEMTAAPGKKELTGLL